MGNIVRGRLEFYCICHTLLLHAPLGRTQADRYMMRYYLIVPVQANVMFKYAAILVTCIHSVTLPALDAYLRRSRISLQYYLDVTHPTA